MTMELFGARSLLRLFLEVGRLAAEDALRAIAEPGNPWDVLRGRTVYVVSPPGVPIEVYQDPLDAQEGAREMTERLGEEVELVFGLITYRPEQIR